MQNTLEQTQVITEISKGLPFPYGATSKHEGMNFAVYAKDLDKVNLCFFYENNLNEPFLEISLNPKYNRTGDVWHALIKGLPANIVYAYRIERNNESLLLMDPYAKCISGEAKWHETIDPNFIYRPLGKAFKHSTFDWQGDTPLNLPRRDLIIYEMHVRGFTRHTSSKVKYPGTYSGMIDKIPHLVDLGINAVELMPIHEFNEQEGMHINPKTNKRLHNYYGYSTANFFSPMIRYASRSDCDKAVIEFKTLVRELHKNGIEVILDVVYNHTFEGNEKGPTLSFKGLDKNAYYMINEQGQYLNFSGCGNTFNCNNPIAIEFIINSLRYWVTEMHVDGFRFDLASIFSRGENGGPLHDPPMIEAISKDPLLRKTKLIAEAWDAGGLYQLGGFAPKEKHWSEWNGKYRDIVRRFIKGTQGHKNLFSDYIYGAHGIYGTTGSPCSSINFVTCHDGFTLADLVSYNEKHNLENGEDNRDGMNENDSWNCGAEGTTYHTRTLNLRKRQMRNFHLALMVSQGIPMLLMGDEYGHTRNGNNNAWCQDNELNWFLWDSLANSSFYRFYKSLVHFRRKHPLLGRDDFLGENDIKWHGVNPDKPEWEFDNRFVAFTLHFPDGMPGLYIAFNASHLNNILTLPPAGENKTWRWVVNTHNSPPSDILDEPYEKIAGNGPLKINSYSAIMLIAK